VENFVRMPAKSNWAKADYFPAKTRQSPPIPDQFPVLPTAQMRRNMRRSRDIPPRFDAAARRAQFMCGAAKGIAQCRLPISTIRITDTLPNGRKNVLKY
jgi:hypothetical protein